MMKDGSSRQRYANPQCHGYEKCSSRSFQDNEVTEKYYALKGESVLLSRRMKHTD